MSRRIDRTPKGYVRVMVDPSDLSRDRYLPREEAMSHYNAGQLARDEETGAFCARSQILPAFLRNAKQAG